MFLSDESRRFTNRPQPRRFGGGLLRRGPAPAAGAGRSGHSAGLRGATQAGTDSTDDKWRYSGHYWAIFWAEIEIVFFFAETSPWTYGSSHLGS